MELQSGNLFFYKKFLWKVKNQRVYLRTKNGEDESATRNKCWTVHSLVERIILLNITLA